MYTPLFLHGRVESPAKFSKGGLDRTLIFRGGLVRKRGDLFEGGCNFHVKNKPKFEIFNDKKS